MKRLVPAFFLLAAAGALFSLPLEPEVKEYAGLQRPKQTLMLSFAGDIMAHSINYAMDDFSAIYRGVEHLLWHDDLSFGNLEYPMVPDKPQASFPDFNVHPSYTEAAIRGGFDVFSAANNHTMDQGAPGALSTLETLERLQAEVPYRIWFSGLKRPEDPWGVTEIRTKGWKIGFFAATEYSNTPADPALLRVVNYRKNAEAEELIRWVSEHAGSYDFFILSFHGGVEYRRGINPGKRDFFLKLLEAGADIVYSHHPHVLQPVELVRTREGEKLIIHSCGNFISGQNRIIDPELPAEEWSYTGDGALFRVEVVEVAGKISIGLREPLLIGNIITPERDVIVLPLETIAALPLYGRWSDFYKGRYEIMSAWVKKDFLVQ